MPTEKRTKLQVGWKLLNDTIEEYSKDRADLAAAALAFYSMLSIAPLILIAVALSGFVLGDAAARAEINTLLSSSMGGEAAKTVNGWVDEAAKSGELASAIGVVLALFAASRLVAALRGALNQVWNVDEVTAEGFKASVKDQIQRRLFGFALVLASAPILLAVFGSRALLSGLHGVLFGASPIAGVVVQISQVLFSIVLVAAMTAVVFRLIPDKRIGWRSILVGSALTSILFNIGNVLVGLYLGRATIAATYGAAGSLVVVLLWLNFSSSMFLLGAEFTQVHAKAFGYEENPDGSPAAPSARPPAMAGKRVSTVS